jgi:hypothetical protein
MGGSGGGGFANFGRPSNLGTGSEIPAGKGGACDSSDECAINTTAILQSPRADVVSSLRVGDILRLQITNGGPPVLAMAPDNNIAGGVIVEIKRLVDCIRMGNSYDAKVLSIDGGAVKLHIYNREI